MLHRHLGGGWEGFLHSRELLGGFRDLLKTRPSSLLMDGTYCYLRPGATLLFSQFGVKDFGIMELYLLFAVVIVCHCHWFGQMCE